MIFSASAAFFLLIERSPRFKRLIYQQNILSESLNTVPRNVVFFSPPEQPEEVALPEYDDPFYRSLRHAQFDIAHVSHTAAAVEIDDLLAPQFQKTHQHSIHPNGNLCRTRHVLFRHFLPFYAVKNKLSDLRQY